MLILVETASNEFDKLGLAKTKLICELTENYRITSDLVLDVNSLLKKCGRVPKKFEDFLYLSTIIYTVDKLISRKFSDDNWTRNIEIHLKLQCSEIFNTNKAEFQNMLNFLTGDRWSLHIDRLESDLFDYRDTEWNKIRDKSSNVSLFSGGLDSLIGCINWLEDNPGEKLILVGHYDPKVPGPRKDQRNLLDRLNEIYPNRLFEVLIKSGQKPTGKETTFRSRSILFIAMGIYAAKAACCSTLTIPENGTIALNIPLTPSRRGTCSTRTAHPYYLNKVQKILNNMDFQMNVVNPYSMLTKGEFVLNCKNLNVLRSTASITRSCAKSGHTKTWVRRNAKNCGRCMPCIYRRAALNKIDLDDEIYGNDLCTGEVDLDSFNVSSDDFRACITFLNNTMDDNEIEKTLYSNAPLERELINEYVDLVKRTKIEIKDFLRNKADQNIQQRVRSL